MSDHRPNILLISTDQQRADHLGCYGAQYLKTPNIDKLASCGTRYNCAYVASPVCMPNRSSIVTGRMPSLHGVRHNGLSLPLNSRTFVEILRNAGYRTSLSGKAHFQCVTKNPPKLKSDSRNETVISEHGRYDQELGPLWRKHPEREMDLPYYGFERVDLAVGHGDQVDGHYNRWVASQNADLAALRGPENSYNDSGYPLFQAWRTKVPEELYPTRYVQKMTEDILARHAQDTSQPFFHWASFCDPHHPFTPPGKYWDMYSPDDVILPESYSVVDNDSWAARLKEIRDAGGTNLAGTAAIAVTETELRCAMALTFGLITMVDDAIGSILEALRRNGQDRKTIVIFLSDHGDLMGDHGLIFKGPFHYQSIIRMPLIWHDPGSQESKVCNDLVNAVDVSASVLDAVGIPAPLGMNGRSFLSDDETSKRDAVLIEDEIQANLPNTNVRGRARTLVTQRWRLTIYDGVSRGELFDLTNDPMETTNRWDDPAFASERADLTERLLREMLANTETGRLPEFAA
ncbi:MAG: sulfatase-like hydrolase/transferase [Pseudomonadota bacterium]